MDRLSQLEIFVKIAETHSFSAAAQHLRLSRSMVSRQISALENELGVRLFNRTTRSLTLTEAGQGYFEQIGPVLARIEEANLSVSHLQATPRGRLRVNAPVSFGTLHLAPALPDFLDKYPDIEINLTLNDRIIDLADEGADLAIRIGRLIDSSLVARRLCTSRRVVCGSPDYFARYGIPQSPEDLRHHQCLCYSNISATEEWRFATPDRRPWPVEVKGRLHANNGDVLRAAALRGQGLANLPSMFIGRDLQEGRLVSVLGDFIEQDSAIHAVYPTARFLSPKVRAFIDFLTARFGPDPYWDRVK